MWVLLALLLALGIFAAAMGWRAPKDADVAGKTSDSTNETAAAVTPDETSGTPKASPHDSAACHTCAAENTGCYAERMLRHATQVEPQYFEDEELDAYRGISAETYSPEQEEEFAEVLHTLKEEEVADWLHALTLRGIELPVALREEAVMMLQG